MSASLATVIRNRRTIRDFNGAEIERETILNIMQDAVWAPFHGKKEPWRFILFTGEGRKRFSEAVTSTYSTDIANKWGEWATRQYCELIPAHLLVIIEADPRQKYWEDAFAASSALIQNIQLLAWERQIGTVWKTNEWNWSPAFHRNVGVLPHERIVGTLHLGYFDKAPKPRSRTPIEDLLTEISQ